MSILKLDEVTFNYPNGVEAVQNISFNIKRGEKVAIVGQNGAGKTTLAKLINGLLKPSEGTVYVNDNDTKKYTTAQISKTVGYVFQNPDDQMFNQTVYEEIAYGPKKMGIKESDIEERVNKLSDILNIKKYLEEHPLNLPFSTRKFVSIASILSMDVDIIILDEPTAGQDFKGMKILSNLINLLEGNHKTVITITHDMQFVVNNFERVIAMSNKQVIADQDKRSLFWDKDIVEKSNIKQPYISEIANELKFSNDILNTSEFIRYMKNNI